MEEGEAQRNRELLLDTTYILDIDLKISIRGLIVYAFHFSSLDKK